MSTQDVVALLAIILPPLIGLVGAIAIPFGKMLMQRLLDRLPSVQKDAADNLATSVVLAVEQQFAGSSGEAKKAAAVEFLRRLADDRGIKLSDSEINVLIEATVAGFNQAIAFAQVASSPPSGAQQVLEPLPPAPSWTPNYPALNPSVAPSVPSPWVSQ